MFGKSAFDLGWSANKSGANVNLLFSEEGTATDFNKLIEFNSASYHQVISGYEAAQRDTDGVTSFEVPS